MKQISLLKAMYLTKEKNDNIETNEITATSLAGFGFYAKENSPYYAELYKEAGETFSLTDLPVTIKC